MRNESPPPAHSVDVTESDADLIAAAGANPDAFRGLYDRHAPRVHRFFVRRVGDEQVALDLTAETFAQAWTSKHRKSTGEAEQGLLGGSWLFHGSNPRCEALSAASFHCTLDEPPAGMTFYDEEGRQVFDVFLGLKRVTVDAEKRVDGACVSLTADGRSWDCYLGEEAVARGLLRTELLGRYWPGPPTG